MAPFLPGRVYLDNAATTPPDDEVLEAMLPYWKNHFGNPSSLYSVGREARLAVEGARKTVAGCLGVRASTLVFTSGGTESNNMAIAGSVRDLGCTHVLYSPTEHHSVLHTLAYYGEGKGITRSELLLQAEGMIDYADLENQLAEQKARGRKCLVCFMHANNETGMLVDLERVGTICRQYGAVFFSDCVQTIGHYPLQLGELPVDLASAAGHKFHGPKGVGLLYMREGLSIGPLLHGGGQERNRRAGTENVAGIVGFAKALEIAKRDYERDGPYIRHLRYYMLQQLQKKFPGILFNGDPLRGLYTVLSVSLPKTEETESLLLHLDSQGICASGGSACSGGAGSHVMEALGKRGRVAIRFSFCKWNTMVEIDQAVQGMGEKIVAGLFSHVIRL